MTGGGQDRKPDLGPDGYRVIQPSNTLRAKVGPGKGVDPARLRAAADAIDGLADDYLDRVKNDLQRVEAGAAVLESDAGTEDRVAAVQSIFAIVHELRGEAGTFGYNLASRVGNMLCVYLDALAAPQDADSRIVRHHCDSLRAIVTANMKGDGGATGKALVSDLTALVRRLS